MFSPKVLIDNDIPVYKAVQKAGEFVITFPKAYHAGFSHGIHRTRQLSQGSFYFDLLFGGNAGFNCGEAVNFAVSDWFEYGEEARHRYSRLGIVPIIHLEQLLCKQAMHLYLNTKEVAEDKCTKPCFVRLVKYYEQALQRLSCEIKKASSSVVEGRVICWVCNRDCYIAYMSCQGCHAYAICLNHGTESYIVIP